MFSTRTLAAAIVTAALALPRPALAHDLYTGVKGKNGQICCGGSDCAVTIYRERGGGFEFRTRENDWVAIPQERITFVAIPGDEPPGDSHYSHLCYRAANETDKINRPDDLFTVSSGATILLYCAFIPPGAT